MRRGISIIVVSALMAGYGAGALAQEPDQTVEPDPGILEQPAEKSFEDEITVTGTLIPRPSLDSLSPVTAMDVSEEFALAGTTRIEDLIATLPQVFPGQNSTIANGATGTASVDLRFLGIRRTLVLLNGRRMAFGDQFAADINAVPGPMVKRVDILTGGASTTYGSDAMAGVVNFIIDTDFTGVRGGFQYSTYQHDNRNELAQQINAEAGFEYPSGVTWDGAAITGFVAVGGSFADGRGHGSAYIDYRQIDELTKSSRDYLNCSVGQGDDGPYCGGSRTTPRGTWAVFNADYSWNGWYTLDLTDEGGDGNSFRPWQNERFNYGPWNHIQRPDDKWNAGGFAHYTINDHFEPYLEVMFMRNYSEAQIAPSGNFGVTSWIHCGNPMLSEQQRDVICTQAGYGPDDYALVVSFRRNVEGDARSNHIGRTNYRLIAGLRGDIDDTWSYDLYGLFAESLANFDYVNDLNVERIQNSIDVIEDPETGEWVCRSGSADGCVPWNIFQEGGVTQEAIDYISTSAMATTTGRTHVANLTFTGDLEDYGLTIPSASEGLQIATGLEYRSEYFDRRPDEVYATGTAGFIGARPPVEGSWDVKELFFEALVPIVQDSRGARDFSLELGYRYSDYNYSGGFNTYKVLLNWAINRSWRLRGGYNRAVRSPTIWELFLPQDVGGGGPDYCANDPDTGVPEGTLEECLRTGMTEEQYGTIDDNGVNTVTGGNPLLEPEVADTFTGGVVWTPQKIAGLSVTVDYYDIDISEVILAPNAWTVIFLCATTGDPVQCGRIHRDDFGSLWIQEEAFVDTTNQNFQLLGAEGIDFNLAYLIGLGNAGYLNTNLVGSYLLSNVIEDPLIAFDCAGYYGPWCGQHNPQWRHRLRATWESSFNLNLSLAWRRVGFSEHTALSPDPDLAGDAEDIERLRLNGVAETPAYDWFDFSASYFFNRNLQLTVGVNNIFDEEPPLMAGLADLIGLGLNIYGNYDPLGRYVFANLQFNF